MMQASEIENFPYKLKTMCYFEVCKDGTVTQIGHLNSVYRDMILAIKDRLNTGKSVLYAAWPRECHTDIFIIDNVDKLYKNCCMQ